MRSQKIRRFDVVISLGKSCQAAYQMKRRGLRTKSGPFDWFTVPTAGLFTVLESDFENFMQQDNLTEVNNRRGYLVVRDNITKIQSLHDFHANQTIQETWPSFRDKMERRIKAFKKDLAESPNVLFIRHGILREESIRLINLLKSIRRGKPCTLLALDQSFSDTEEPYDKDIISMHMPQQDNSWKGSNAEWNRVLSHIGLSYFSFRQYQDRFACIPIIEKIQKRLSALDSVLFGRKRPVIR